MSNNKDQQAILSKLGISELNEMQIEAGKYITEKSEVVLLSPTGTGKTLAFLLPILERLDASLVEIQALIVVPSRELAIQIEQVIREMGSGHKAIAVYGGKSGSKDRIELKHPPTILVGTPGRVADHIRTEVINTAYIKTLVLDEFDKSLEIGFQEEMEEILTALTKVDKKILTSATQKAKVPRFVGLQDAKHLNFLKDSIQNQIEFKIVDCPNDNKLESLARLLIHIGTGNGIVFCNLKDSINEVSEYLFEAGIDHTCFHGSLEQMDRERSLIKFRNGTHRILLATDLAARGIDVPELDFIVHYQLPFKKEEFTHRNGRTGRMNSTGTSYIMKWVKEPLPSFIPNVESIKLIGGGKPTPQQWETIYISGGRKDKISKGDIAGLFFKQGNLEKNELGIIELKQDASYVSVPFKKAKSLVSKLNNARLKKRKVRMSILK
jgi:superfamily II DNA/RNA helicase